MSFGRLLFICAAIGTTGVAQTWAQVLDTGAISYTPLAQTTNAACSGTTNNFDNFTGTISDSGLFAPGNVTFGFCDNSATLADGEFTVTNAAGDMLSGTLSGQDLGYTMVNSNEAMDSYEGTFTITGATGTDVANEPGFSADFTATDTINPSNPAAGGSGNFTVFTPEPSTMALLGLGLAGAGLIRRRRNKK